MMRNSNFKIKYPILMKPVFKDYIWGGEKLVKEWGKESPYSITAESWELSAHKNGQSTADNGPLEGMTLSEIVQTLGQNCLGTKSLNDDRFPILIKLIDPKLNLSVQVHPSDEYALENEGDYGKTEMWYIVDAEPNSSILCGFKEDINKDIFTKAIESNSLVELMNKIPVKKGDVYFIEPGTVHAICTGMIVAEIQQNSDITYRVYDYDRKGPDGKGRKLHIKKAKIVSKLTASNFDGTGQGEFEKTNFGTKRLLVSCKYFVVNEYVITNLKSATLIADDKSFHSILFLDGSGTIKYNGKHEEFKRGGTFFIPAGMGTYTIEGKSSFLLTNR